MRCHRKARIVIEPHHELPVSTRSMPSALLKRSPPRSEARLRLLKRRRIAAVCGRAWEGVQAPEPLFDLAVRRPVNAAVYLLATEDDGPIVRGGARDARAAEGQASRRRARRGGPCPESINHVLFASCTGIATESSTCKSRLYMSR